MLRIPARRIILLAPQCDFETAISLPLLEVTTRAAGVNWYRQCLLQCALHGNFKETCVLNVVIRL